MKAETSCRLLLHQPLASDGQQGNEAFTGAERQAYRLAWQVTKRCCWVGHSQYPESKLRHSGTRLFDPCSRELRSNTKGNHGSQKDTLPE